MHTRNLNCVLTRSHDQRTHLRVKVRGLRVLPRRERLVRACFQQQTDHSPHALVSTRIPSGRPASMKGTLNASSQRKTSLENVAQRGPGGGGGNPRVKKMVKHG